MLQVFHVDVAKVDRDVAYVAMAIHVYCERLFQMFHLFFQTYVANMFYLDVTYVSHICCKCFIWMSHMLCNGFSSVSSVLDIFQVFHLSLDVCCKCFI
jgi:hypothetical protein